MTLSSCGIEATTHPSGYNKLDPKPTRINSARWRGLENKEAYNSTATAKTTRPRPQGVRARGETSLTKVRHQHTTLSVFDGPTPVPTPTTDPPQSMAYKHIVYDYNMGENNPGNMSDIDDDVEQGHGPQSSQHQQEKKKKASSRADNTLLQYIDEGDDTQRCKYCGANFWFNERTKKDRRHKDVDIFSICCLKGKVVLPPVTKPPQLLVTLFTEKQSKDSKNFNENIRQYNNMFSFTSMGGKIDPTNIKGGGPYSFTLNGMNYHSIGSLLPPEGAQPVYSQLYICDTQNEVNNRISAISKYVKEHSIDPFIVTRLKHMLDETNPFVKQYRIASNMLCTHQPVNVKLRLISTRQHDGRTYNLPDASEVAALIVGDIDVTFNVRDIIVESVAGTPKRINELHPSYLPLQYPLLFPYGDDGYRDDIQHREETLRATKTRKRVSLREFFSYRLMLRENDLSVLHHASKLLQQFIVDGYTMIESQRLLWVRLHQKDLRADLYQGLSDAVLNGEHNASSTGKRVILPASFTSSARYMIKAYQDAMAICRAVGYPDLFITFTCNPAWPEIKRYCDRWGLKPPDCPTVISRIFAMKLKSLMQTIKRDKVFGRVRADMYTIEFQKRGLPHAHILIFLDHEDSIKDPKGIDNVICAEIPDKRVNPELHELVQRFMIHGPCGHAKPKARCMKDKRCSKYFPKQFNPSTTVDDNGYPTYRRRDDGRTVEVKGVPLDNRYVVPYNPTLLYMYQAHINIEKCNHSTAIKYLFKYISKGDDRVVVGLFDRSQQCNGDCVVDEILQYYNCRYVSSCEASWRIFGFDIHHRNPPVERLSFHLPNQQYVVFTSTTDMSSLIDNPRVCESQFLAWMLINKENLHARSLTYSEFPRHYVFEKDKRMWKKRRRGFAIGRISHVSPSAGELYYLRVMLTQVRGPTSFDDIKTVDGVVHKTFKEACFAMGLLDDDKEYISALKEAATWASGYSLRRFFVSMLLCSSIQRPEFVWEQTATLLSDDLFYVPREDPNFAGFHVAGVEKQQAALGEIDSLLRQNGKSLDDFPGIIFDRNSASQHSTNHLILQEMAYNKDELKALANSLTMRFNSDQKGDIVLAVASSGIAATLLPAGRTAHSRFAIPLQVTETSTCNMNQNSMLAELVRLAKLIIWDEAPMVQRLCVEAFDRSLKDIMHCDRPFGGKCIVMGGDFRQILPVIPQGTRASIVNACITSSYLWKYCTVFQLSQNMRLDTCKTDKGRHRLQAFAKWLLDIGDGNIGHNVDGTSDVDILPDLLVEGGRDPIAAIVAATYESLITNLTSNDYFNERAILAPTVETVNKINKHMCTMLPGEEHVYLSCDSICKSCCDSDSFDDLYTNEFLNTIECSGLPCHRLVLKVGAPIMLLRNIDQASGLCNGTRLRVTKLGRTVVEAITLNGSKPNQRVLIHRMDMNPSESRWPFKMQRRQFPINLSFAMTINKSQGQSLRRVGLLLSRPVFTHGQLYVALSRVRSMDGLKVVVDNGDGNQLTITKNVVYKEIFQNIHIS